MGRLRLLAAVTLLVSAMAPVVARAAAPEATVKITDYSARVSGNIGEPVAGVRVSLALDRSALGAVLPVSTAHVVTSAKNGDWSADLSPANGFGAPGDTLQVRYAAPRSAPTTPVPTNFAYTLGGTSTSRVPAARSPTTAPLSPAVRWLSARRCGS
jgi:hypothetical protein